MPDDQSIEGEPREQDVENLREVLSIDEFDINELRVLRVNINFAALEDGFVIEQRRIKEENKQVDVNGYLSVLKQASQRFIVLEDVCRQPEGVDEDLNDSACHLNLLQKVGWNIALQETPELELANDPTVRKAVDTFWEKMGKLKYFDTNEVLKDPNRGAKVFRLAQDALSSIFDYYQRNYPLIAKWYISFLRRVAEETKNGTVYSAKDGKIVKK